MNDRQLLELAAEAAGIRLAKWDGPESCWQALDVDDDDREVGRARAGGCEGVEGPERVAQIGDDADHSDTIYFSPSYWQQYSVDPHSEDPLDLDFDEDEDDEDEDDDE